jgi:ribonuclease BN (tRNA processing enzyme)
MTPAGGDAPRLRFLGTGDAFSSDGRFPSVLLVEWDGRRILVDAGPCTHVCLARAGIPVSSIDALLVTHLHGDHVAGIPFLQLVRKFEGASNPLRIAGPVGVGERVELLWKACYAESLQTPPVAVSEHPPERGAFELCGARVEVVPMEHLPHSIGFRISLGTTTIAYSGDTRWCPELIELCAGVDLAIVECTMLEPGEPAHLSLAELRRERGTLATDDLVLTHTSGAVLEALAGEPVERTRAAADGLVLDLTGTPRSDPS